MAVKKALESASKALVEEVQRWGEKKQTGVSLRYMTEFGSKPTEKNLLISAQFLHNELPIRIARRAIELESLPHGLSEKPAVLKGEFKFKGFHGNYKVEVVSLTKKTLHTFTVDQGNSPREVNINLQEFP